MPFTRTCGGDPVKGQNVDAEGAFYPHLRGWSYPLSLLLRYVYLLPAPAGVILSYKFFTFLNKPFTRTCGGDPGLSA